MKMYLQAFLVLSVTFVSISAGESLLIVCRHLLQIMHADCTCGDETQKNVRLVGRSKVSGRLEVCRNGKWNTVCGQKFNSTDATVVCRELGFSDQGENYQHSPVSYDNTIGWQCVQ